MEFGLTRVQVISFHRGEFENHWNHTATRYETLNWSLMAHWSAFCVRPDRETPCSDTASLHTTTRVHGPCSRV